MRITRRLLINTIAFIVLSAGLVVLLAVQVLPTVFGSTYPVYAIFPSAGGVATNQEVTYRGVQVGRVGAMSLTKNAVKIEMIIDSKYRIPKDGTRAQVLFKSAVGEQFIDLIPSRADGPTFRAGDVIGEQLTQIPIQIEDLLKELDSVLKSVPPGDLGSLVHELGQGLSGHGEDLRSLIKMLDQLATVGADRAPQIESMLSNGAALQDAFNSNSAEFEQAMASLNTVLQTAASRANDLSRTFRATTTLDTDLISLLSDRKPQIETIVGDLGTATRITHDHLADVDKTLTYLGSFFADVSKAYYAPYFVFNTLANPEPLDCSYNPSSRPVRPVTDASFKEPATHLACAGSSAAAASTGAVAPVSVSAQLDLQRVSWLRLFMDGTS